MLPPRMCSLRGALAAALVASFAMTTTTVQNCQISSDASRRALATVSSQAELDGLIGDCTTLTGDITIAHNYTGSFILHTVSTLHGEIASEYSVGPPVYLNNPSLTSIEAPDLTSMTGLLIYNSSALKNISFPKAETVEWTLTINSISSLAISFPQMQNLTAPLILTGSVASMDFSRLELVKGKVVVSSSYDQIDSFVDFAIDVDRSSYPPIDVDFPALAFVNGFHAVGNISRVTTKLVNATTYAGLQGVRISSYGTAVDLNFPDLKYTDFIALSGTIGQISLPVLESVDDYGLNASLPIEANLESLKNAGRIEIVGNITSLSMDSIDTVGSMTIRSVVPLDCSPARAAWDRSNARNSNPEYGYTCAGAEHHEFWTLGRKLGLGLGLGLGIPALLIASYLAYRSWKKGRGAASSEEKHPAAPKPAGSQAHLAPAHEDVELTSAGGRPVSAVSSVSALSDSGEERRDIQAGVAPTQLER